MRPPLIGKKLTGAVLTGSNETPECCLAPIESGDWTIRQYLPDNPCNVWRSVTPVVLRIQHKLARRHIGAEDGTTVTTRLCDGRLSEEQIEGPRQPVLALCVEDRSTRLPCVPRRTLVDIRAFTSKSDL